MPIYNGNTKYNQVYYGIKKVGKIYDGTKLVYSSKPKSTFDPILEHNTWEQISQASASGIAQELWNIGDTKSIHIDGTVGTQYINGDFEAVIISFDHNEEIEGKGITFQLFWQDGTARALTDSMYNKSYFDRTGKYFTINHTTSATNSGGWQGCDMRYDILGSVHEKGEQYAAEDTAINPVENTLMAALEFPLRRVMKPIVKWTNNRGGDNTRSAVTETTDYLPLIAEFEYAGRRGYANIYEMDKQKRYSYYEINDLKKYRINSAASGGDLVDWFVRSCSAYYNSSWVGYYLDNKTIAANDSYGIAPIFKV